MVTDIEHLYEKFLSHSEITTDSRNVPEGSIFFALKGPNFDGNKYALEALKKGAAFAVVDDTELQINERCIYVGDTLKALQELGKYHRLKLDIPIIGITGSNGKTTTKELINAVLSKNYIVQCTKGNLNNHIGVPLTLLTIQKSHEIAIIEMGSNGKGEIEFLSDLCKPDIAIITSIGKAHLEGFGNINGVVEEKTGLYRSAAKRNKTIFYNQESPYLREKLPIRTENIPYSRSLGFLFEYVSKSTFPFIRGLCLRGDQIFHLTSKMYGAYNVLNIVSALSIGIYFDVHLKDAVEAVNGYIPKNNRSEIRKYKGANLFLDAYNANPSSVKLVVQEISKSLEKNILVLGDMLELGSNEIAEHREVLDEISMDKFEEVILFGPLYHSLLDQYPQFKFFNEFGSLKNYFNSLNLVDRNVLLKGSRGMGLERLII